VRGDRTRQCARGRDEGTRSEDSQGVSRDVTIQCVRGRDEGTRSGDSPGCRNEMASEGGRDKATRKGTRQGDMIR
jgi:hypothetical protein